MGAGLRAAGAPKRYRPLDPSAAAAVRGALLGSAVAQLGEAHAAASDPALESGLAHRAVHGAPAVGQQQEPARAARRAGRLPDFRPRLASAILEPVGADAGAVASDWPRVATGA